MALIDRFRCHAGPAATCSWRNWASRLP